MTSTRTTNGRAARAAFLVTALASLLTGVSMAQASPQRTQPLPAYYGTTAPYASEASLPSAQGLKADGLRWQGLARVYQQKQTGAQATSISTSNAFNWADAGIGVAVGIGAMLVVGAAAVGVRRQSRLATH